MSNPVESQIYYIETGKGKKLPVKKIVPLPLPIYKLLKIR